MLTTPAEDVVSLKVYAIPSSAKEGFKQVAQISIPPRNKPSVFSAEILDFIPDLPPEERPALEKSIAFIMKSTGLDGLSRTKVTTTDRETFDTHQLKKTVTKSLLKYIDIADAGAENRILSLAALCQEIEPSMQKVLHTPSTRACIKAMRDFYQRYQSTRDPQKKQGMYNKTLTVEGIDLNCDPVIQHTRTLRQVLWREGPDTIIEKAAEILADFDEIAEENRSASAKMADRNREKNLARLEEKRKKQQKSPVRVSHTFLSAGDFDRVPSGAELSTNEKIKIIMKAAGLDGPDIGQGLDLSALPQDSVGGILLQKRDKIRNDFLTYIDAENPGAKGRIDHLFDLARQTERALEQLSTQPARQRNLEILISSKSRFEKLEKHPFFSDSERHQSRVDILARSGVDVDHDVTQQDITRQRLEIWSFGVHALTNDFDSVVSTITTQIKSAEETYFSPEERLRLLAQEKNLARLEEKKKKQRKDAPAPPMHGFLSTEDFDRVSLDTDLSTDEKLKIIMKAAGVDGPEPGAGFDLSEIPEGSGAERSIKIYAAIKNDIFDYANMEEPGAEGRIDVLLSLAAQTEAARATLVNFPMRNRNLAMFEKDQKSLKRYPAQKRKENRQDCFIKTGLDLNLSIADQMIDHERQDFWKFGPEALINDFDSVFDYINESLDELGQKHLSPTQRRAFSSHQRDLQRLQDAAHKRLKKRNNDSPQGGSSETTFVFTVQEDPQAGRREKIETILNAALTATGDLQNKLQDEKSRIPGNQTYLEEQALLLEIAEDDFETVRAAVLSMHDRKQVLLDQLEAAGQSVLASETPADIKAALNRIAEGRPAAQNEAQPESGSAALLATYRDLDEFRDDFPDLYEKIAAARAAQDALSNACLAAQDENLRIGVATRQAESSMARTIALTEKLQNHRTDLTIELEQLAYRLENPEADATLSAIFQVKAKYPPLSHIESWANDNLDKSRIIILPAAFKRAAASPYSNPDLVFDALKLLENECWEMHFAGKSDPEVRKSYADQLAALGLTDASSKIGKIDPKIRDKYTAWVDGKKYDLDHHFKRTTSRTKQHCFRLYYAYDNPNERIIVGHMPDHLPTTIS